MNDVITMLRTRLRSVCPRWRLPFFLRFFCVMTETRWRLRLLGQIALTGPDAAAAERVMVQPKHLALLCHLALAVDAQPDVVRHHRRDELAALLWPDLDDAHARASLRRVVHQIRSALGASVVVSRGDEEIALDRSAITSDAEAFERLVAEGHLAAALELWRGELMPGFHVNECDELDRRFEERRQSLREAAGAAAWALAQRLEASDDLSQATSWARRVPRFSPDDERVLRRALTMLDRLGDRAGALRVYDDFASRLRKEFDAEPSDETRTLIARIRGPG